MSVDGVHVRLLLLRISRIACRRFTWPDPESYGISRAKPLASFYRSQGSLLPHCREALARETGNSRNTVRRYLRDESAARYKPRRLRATELDPFRDYVIEPLTSARPGWSPTPALPAELRAHDHAHS